MKPPWIHLGKKKKKEKKKLTGKVPMIPSALIAALAIIRLGAIHAAVFGGFAAQSLAQRIEAARPKAIMTASCGIEGTRVIPYRPLVERALQLVQQNQSQDQTQGQGQGLCKTFIWQRDQCRWNQPDKRGGQRNWQRVVKSARFRGVRADAVPVRSDEGVYIIYTSGAYASLCLSMAKLTPEQGPRVYPKACCGKPQATPSVSISACTNCSISSAAR